MSSLINIYNGKVRFSKKIVIICSAKSYRMYERRTHFFGVNPDQSGRASSLSPNPTANFAGFEGRQRTFLNVAPLPSEI